MKIKSHTELIVYQKAMSAALKVFELLEDFSKGRTVFPDRSDASRVAGGSGVDRRRLAAPSP